MPEEPCCYCPAPATLLCDWVVSVAAAGYAAVPLRDTTTGHVSHTPGAAYTTLDTPMHTCDRPLCATHAHQQSLLFWCGDVGAVETEDYCPQHHAAALAGARLPRPR